VLVDVGVCASAGELGNLAVLVAGDEQGEVAALAVGEAGEGAQRLERRELVFEGDAARDEGLPGAVGGERLQVRLSSLERREPVGLVDGDDVEPGNTEARSGWWRRSWIQACWQASSISTAPRLTRRETARISSPWWWR
jgi:hypothetical protein